ncbi:hypothetical protein K3495_g2936 [Podosphaera aphanis]|nr:hypothetical protein K3495_g2936 [Podosphaera aphanis]
MCGAYAWVDREESMTSDYFPISGIVPTYTGFTRKTEGPPKVPKDMLPLFAQLVFRWMPHAHDLTSIDEIEQFAQDLCKTLGKALKAVGKVSNGGSGRSAPWWSPECMAARLQSRTASTEIGRNQYAKAYGNVIAGAKMEHWNGGVEDMLSPSDIYRLMR